MLKLRVKKSPSHFRLPKSGLSKCWKKKRVGIFLNSSLERRRPSCKRAVVIPATMAALIIKIRAIKTFIDRLILADDTAVFLSKSYEPFFFLAHTGPLFTIDIVIA